VHELHASYGPEVRARKLMYRFGNGSSGHFRNVRQVALPLDGTHHPHLPTTVGFVRLIMNTTEQKQKPSVPKRQRMGTTSVARIILDAAQSLVLLAHGW